MTKVMLLKKAIQVYRQHGLGGVARGLLAKLAEGTKTQCGPVTEAWTEYMS